MKISVESNNETVFFAASELQKYLKMMFTDNNFDIGFKAGEIKIGLFGDLNIEPQVGSYSDCDDVLYIETKGFEGVISGNNPGSVLLSVYEYLKAEGCRWLFPGIDGEYIPKLDKISDVSLIKKMPTGVRGQCIEGAISIDSLLAAIDFAPKIGLNSYMLECFSPYGYLLKWYLHSKNNIKKSEEISEDTAIQWKRLCEAEIAKRGLSFHDMGHGWTTLVFGINPDSGEISVDNAKYLAKINGKKQFHDDCAINTNFCMTNEDGRKKFVKYVVDYAKRHNNVNYLHIWLADGSNNHCECDNCLNFSPSELYVSVLNEIDTEFTRNNIEMKIVFVCYADLFFAPEKNKIENPDRFMLLFAPISRDYLSSYGVKPNLSNVKKYERNKNVLPKTMEDCLGYLRKWREKFSGEVFCYEYHFYKIVYFDFGGIWLARCAFDDVRGLKKNRLCGMIEDQSQRNAYPTGFAIYAWARAMCDEKIEFEEIAADYFSNAFGKNWRKAYDFLNKISNAFSKEYMLGSFAQGNNTVDKRMQNNMKEIKKAAEEFKSVCDDNIKTDERCQTVSWKLLGFHCDLCIKLSSFFYELACGDDSGMIKRFDEFKAFLSENEDFYSKYLDLFLFETILERMLNKINPAISAETNDFIG